MSRSLSTTRSQPGLRLAAVLPLALALLVLAAPASGAGCWKRLVNDWADGRIDRSYPAVCYRQALADANQDLLDYSSLPSDLQRALLGAVHGVVPAGQIGAQGGPRYKRAVRDQPALPRPRKERHAHARGGGGVGGWEAVSAPAPGGSQLPFPVLALLGAGLLLLAGGAGSVLRRRRPSRSGQARR